MNKLDKILCVICGGSRMAGHQCTTEMMKECKALSKAKQQIGEMILGAIPNTFGSILERRIILELKENLVKLGIEVKGVI